jgi:tetratricopeptide (TPR) repeat protein
VHSRSLSVMWGALVAGALVSGLIPSGEAQAQLARRTSSEKILVLNPIPGPGADSAYAVALAEALRTRLASKYRFRLNVVPTEDYCAVLEASGYTCTQPLAPGDAPPLARVLLASGYVVSWLRMGSDSVVLTVRMVDVARSGLSGWEHIGAPAGTAADDLARLVADRLDNRVRAAEYARECESRRERTDPRGAAAQAARAFELFPNHPSAASCLALAHEVAHAPVDSIIAALRRVVAGDSLNKRGWEDLSRRLVEKGDTAGAVQAAMSQLKADPTDAGLRVRVAGALIVQGEYAQAVEILDQGLANNPGDMPLLALKERACVEGSLWPCALEAMQARFEVDTALADDSLFYTGAFAAAQEAEDTAAMLRWSEDAVGKFPESVSLWRARAAALKAADQRQAALEAYDRILALDSTQAPSALAAAQYLLDSTMVIDTTMPLDTARLLKAERLLELVAARASGDTVTLVNVAALLYNPAAKIAQLRMLPHLPIATRFLEKALQYDLRGQLRLPANFFLGLSLFFQIGPLDEQVRKTKSCDLVDRELDMTRRTRTALSTGRAVAPQTADQLLGYVSRYEEAQRTYKPVFKCS